MKYFTRADGAAVENGKAMSFARLLQLDLIFPKPMIFSHPLLFGKLYLANKNQTTAVLDTDVEEELKQVYTQIAESDFYKKYGTGVLLRTSKTRTMQSIRRQYTGKRSDPILGESNFINAFKIVLKDAVDSSNYPDKMYDLSLYAHPAIIPNPDLGELAGELIVEQNELSGFMPELETISVFLSPGLHESSMHSRYTHSSYKFERNSYRYNKVPETEFRLATRKPLQHNLTGLIKNIVQPTINQGEAIYAVQDIPFDNYEPLAPEKVFELFGNIAEKIKIRPNKAEYLEFTLKRDISTGELFPIFFDHRMKDNLISRI